MQGRRYSEGGDIPTLSFPAFTGTVTDKLRTKRRTKYIVPNISGISTTSNAADCFVKREFSKKLQQFMLNYSYTLVTSKVLSGEV